MSEHLCSDDEAASVTAYLKIAAAPRVRHTYVSKAARISVHTKIQGIDPADLPASFLEEISVSLSRYGCRVVAVGARAGCIELVMDLQVQLSSSNALNVSGSRLLSPEPPIVHTLNSGCRLLSSEPPIVHTLNSGSRLLSSELPSVAAAAAGSSASCRFLANSDGGITGVETGGAVAVAVGGEVRSRSVDMQELLLAQLHPVEWLQLLRQQLPASAGDCDVRSQLLSGSWVSSAWDPVSATHVLKYQVPVAGTPHILNCPAVLLLPPPPPRHTTPSQAADMSLEAGVQERKVIVTVGWLGEGALALSVRDCARYLAVQQSPCGLGLEHRGGGASYEVAITDAAQLSQGLLVVECAAGGLTSNSQPVVVTSDAALASEICWLVQEAPGQPRAAERTAGVHMT
ncbi:MAG: hypothetical protein WDW38_010240 [Sanguina aurantia]